MLDGRLHREHSPGVSCRRSATASTEQKQRKRGTASSADRSGAAPPAATQAGPLGKPGKRGEPGKIWQPSKISHDRPSCNSCIVPRARVRSRTCFACYSNRRDDGRLALAQDQHSAHSALGTAPALTRAQFYYLPISTPSQIPVNL